MKTLLVLLGLSVTTNAVRLRANALRVGHSVTVRQFKMSNPDDDLRKLLDDGPQVQLIPTDVLPHAQVSILPEQIVKADPPVSGSGPGSVSESVSGSSPSPVHLPSQQAPVQLGSGSGSGPAKPPAQEHAEEYKRSPGQPQPKASTQHMADQQLHPANIAESQPPAAKSPAQQQVQQPGAQPQPLLQDTPALQPGTPQLPFPVDAVNNPAQAPAKSSDQVAVAATTTRPAVTSPTTKGTLWHWPWESFTSPECPFAPPEPCAARILVINMKQSEDRRAFMQKQCSKLNQVFMFVEAQDAKNLGPAAKERYAAENAFKLTPIEIAIVLSHKSAWQKIVSDKLPYAAILEDDVTLADGLQDLNKNVADLQQMDPNWSILFLAFNHDASWKREIEATLQQNRGKFTPRVGGRYMFERAHDAQFWTDKDTSLHRFVQPYPRWGCFGMVVSQKGAQQLLKMLEKDGIQYPVDWQLWMNQKDEKNEGLHIYAFRSAVEPISPNSYKMLVTHKYTFKSTNGHRFQENGAEAQRPKHADRVRDSSFRLSRQASALVGQNEEM